MEDNKPKGFSSWGSEPEEENNNEELELMVELEPQSESEPEPEVEVQSTVESEPVAEETAELKSTRHHYRDLRPLVKIKSVPKRGEFAAKTVRP